MAKKEIDEEVVEQKSSKFQAFILIFLLPLLFAIAVLLIVINAAGYNVFDLAKEYGSKIPILKNYVEVTDIPSVETFEREMILLEADIKDKEAKITKLEKDLANKDTEVVNLNEEIEKLNKEITILNEQKNENTKALSDLVKTYETMAAKKAAAILEEMSADEALQILSKLKSDTLADILSKMAPEKAAIYTELLSSKAKEN